MKSLFILNPLAGKGAALKLLPEIKNCCDAGCHEYTIETTKYPGHATEIASYYSAMDDYRIYSVGGDGTLNEVLNGMAGSGSSLAVIPVGCGNDFIRSITGEQNMNNIVARTIEGIEKSVDLAKANGKYFINISSMGFDGLVNYNTINIKKIPYISGSVAYILGILVTLIKYKNYNLKISIDNETIETKSLLVAVCNGKYYGGGIQPAPTASVDDGMFDICIVKDLNVFQILVLFPKYKKGKHTKLKEVRFYSGQEVIIKSDCPIAVNIDGEIGLVTEMVFELIPKGIKFVIPRNF